MPGELQYQNINEEKHQKFVQLDTFKLVVLI